MGCVIGNGIVITFSETFEAGDPRPTGYLDVAEWMDAQVRGGLKQSQCPKCGLWNFPQEVCDHTIQSINKLLYDEVTGEKVFRDIVPGDSNVKC